ncbi:Aminomethyltransferase folate-binding domain-containing protein, partial [Westerdykella ornata]
TATASQLKPAECGIVRLDNRRLVSVAGPDAAKFLQGLITNNVNPASSTPFYSAFLDARGRMLWDVFIYPTTAENNAEWGCLIEVDAGEAQALMRTLKKYKVRSKVTIRLLEEDSADAMTVWAGWGNAQDLTEELTRIGDSIAYIARDLRAGNMPGQDYFGVRFLMCGNAPPEIDGVPLLNMDQYRLRRYMLGIAEGPAEIQRESALPMECNVDLAGGIDFRKGCYLGQELTIRTKHQGVVRKRILPVQLADQRFQVTEPLDIKQLDETGSIKKGRSAGKLLASIGNVGLALCRLEMMTPMRVSAEGGSYKPGVEFAVQTPPQEEGSPAKDDSALPMRVKAFLPEWLLSKESAIW